MNTNVYLWIEPISIRNKRSLERLHFNVVIKGEHFDKDLSEVDDIISGDIMSDIMEYADISNNWNYGIISATETSNDISINFAKSPKEIENDIKIISFLNSTEPIKLDKTNVIAKDDGNIDIIVEDLCLSQTLDVLNIWKVLEKNVIGKIQVGDKIELTDDNGNIIYELLGGSFLNIGIADIGIYGKNNKQLKGGIFIRTDGTLHIGNFDRTFFFTSIHK